MKQIETPRLSSAHLEDLAYFTLAARSDCADIDLYPRISDNVRHRLRVRIKQMSRYDWPSHMGEDKHIRKGYTLRQCFRLMVVLQMLDAHLPPSLAVRASRNNELGLMDIIVARLLEPERTSSDGIDVVAIMCPAEIRDLDADGWADTQSARLRYVARSDLSGIWTGSLDSPGPRLAIDVGAAAITIWCWISGRRLLDDTARTSFLNEIAAESDVPRYRDVPSRDKPRS